MMAFLTFFGWTGIARIVRGQILSLREQEFMVSATARGLSTKRKIFRHLIPNVMPQLIVSMTLGLGSVILSEATLSYLNLGVPKPYAAWGGMIGDIKDPIILQNYPNLWVPAGLCIVLAVLAFNFIGDGLRDAFDPKSKK
jgi:peptide/nickel transport system permease protein